MPTPSKKRYSIQLSGELAERFDRVTRRRKGAKSAIIAEMLDRRLNPERYPLIDDGVLRRLDTLSKDLADIKRDVAIATEMVSLFVRYYLTITPPLAASEHHAARTLGKERFQIFVAQVGRRLASDQRLVSDVLETIAVNDPDLFAVASDDAPLKARPATAGATEDREDTPDDHPATPSPQTRHG
jgi:predicted DNA-binding protein